MDRKVQRGYLVGYDWEERYRVYIPEDSRDLLSRDVRRFRERKRSQMEKNQVSAKCQ